MGCGGTATSGHGLSSCHVRAALQLFIDHLGDEPAEPDDVEELLEGTRFQKEKRVHSVTINDGSRGETEVRVVEYAPRIFRALRAASCVSDDLLRRELALDEVQLKLGAGRSNALFMPSAHRVFLCKTIGEEEVEVLLRILQPYLKHLREHPHTLLTRFYFLIAVEVGSNFGYIVCFHDICARATTIQEKWDLKGRVVKPGKFDVKESAHEDALATELRRTNSLLFGPTTLNREPSTTSSPRPFEPPSKIKGAETTHGSTVEVLKDKSLTRLFWLRGEDRNALVLQLCTDYAFLASMGLMDYSIFIAVSYSPSSSQLSTFRRMHDEQGDVVEERDVTEEALAALPHNSGFPSVLSQEVYFIGIIDMLTYYTFKKRFSNFAKGFLWKERTLSTIPPDDYQKRIERFTRSIFPVEV